MLSRGTGLWSRLFGWAERFGNIWSLISGLGVISMAGLTAWAAWAGDLFAQYAPFSWVAAGILGGLAVALTMLAAAFARLQWAQARATNKWQEAVSGVNPLKETFQGERIRIADLVSPIDSSIEGKTFIDCELIGPANMIVISTGKGKASISGSSFAATDWVLVDEGTNVHNAIALIDCTILRGTLYRVTLLVPRGAAQVFEKGFPAIPWLNGAISPATSKSQPPPPRDIAGNTPP